jgi:serine acetyltransferase
VTKKINPITTIRNSIRVAKECVIGAGSVILHDTNEKEVYAAHSTVKLEVTNNQLRNL